MKIAKQFAQAFPVTAELKHDGTGDPMPGAAAPVPSWPLAMGRNQTG